MKFKSTRTKLRDQYIQNSNNGISLFCQKNNINPESLNKKNKICLGIFNSLTRTIGYNFESTGLNSLYKLLNNPKISMSSLFKQIRRKKSKSTSKNLNLMPSNSTIAIQSNCSIKSNYVQRILNKLHKAGILNWIFNKGSLRQWNISNESIYNFQTNKGKIINLLFKKKEYTSSSPPKPNTNIDNIWEKMLSR